MHYAMITLGASGHVFSALPMIEHLVKKGNRVSFFSIPRYKEMIESIGAEYHEVRSALTNNGQADRDVANDMMAELSPGSQRPGRPPSTLSSKQKWRQGNPCLHFYFMVVYV